MEALAKTVKALARGGCVVALDEFQSFGSVRPPVGMTAGRQADAATEASPADVAARRRLRTELHLRR